jgi:hypothetical protein
MTVGGSEVDLRSAYGYGSLLTPKRPMGSQQIRSLSYRLNNSRGNPVDRVGRNMKTSSARISAG